MATLGLVLAVAAPGGGHTSFSCANPACASELEVREVEYALTATPERVTPGKVTFVVRNDGWSSHTFAIEGLRGAAYLAPGYVVRVTAKLRPGSYVLYCTVPGHDTVMRATVKVAA